MSTTIRPAVEADLAAAKSMLVQAGLPVEDLLVGHLAFVAEADDGFAGAVGLEDFGAIGLLRSLVIVAGRRSSGLGRDLVATLENDVRKRGMRELWLLTIDADAYFRRLGYAPRDRVDAPDAIRNTAEFSALCPGDAVLMSKRL